MWAHIVFIMGIRCFKNEHICFGVLRIAARRTAGAFEFRAYQREHGFYQLGFDVPAASQSMGERHTKHSEQRTDVLARHVCL